MLKAQYPKIWDEISESLSKSDRIMVIGGTDRGKSTFSIYTSLKKGMPLLDADIGQATIPPPTVIKLSEDRVSISKGFFVGSTTPVKNFLAYIFGLSYVSQGFKQGMIIDTCGLIRGSHGFWLKVMEAIVLDPDLVIAMSRGNDLEHIVPFLREVLGKEVLDIGASSYARKRSRSERYERRKLKFKNYFGQGKVISVFDPRIFSFPKNWNIDKSLINVITNGSVKRASIIGDTLYVICEDFCRGIKSLKKLYNTTETYILTSRKLKNLLVGLYSKEEFLGVGIVESLDLDSMKFDIYVSEKFPEKEVTGLQLGYLKITREGDEIRR